MNKFLKRSTPAAAAILAAVMLCSCGAKAPDNTAPEYTNAHTVTMSGDSAVVDGKAAEEFDYTWCCDPGVAHDEVKNAPAEYHTGTKPDTDSAVYIDHDLAYMPTFPEEDFKLVKYDPEFEWAYYYRDGENDDYIFATLPRIGGTFPAEMMHTPEEAAENKVLHITQPGAYILEGEWKGQILVDLGDKDETFADETAKVILVFNGAQIDCSVAPGVMFYSAYECDNTWEEQEKHTADIKNTDAGAVVIIADGTENTVNGANVFRMLKTKYKDENSTKEIKLQKKMRKTDGAFYSYVSMAIYGEAENTGKLTVNSTFEGLDTELHLFFHGGNVTINSQNDGVNVNEDNVSSAIFTGGSITINAGLSNEGDGVDSNGFMVIDGCTMNIASVRLPDNELDSGLGIYYRSGDVFVDGVKQEYKPGDTFRENRRIGAKSKGAR